MTTKSRHENRAALGGIAVALGGVVVASVAVATAVGVAQVRARVEEAAGLHIPTPWLDGIDPGTIDAVRRLTHR